MASDDASHACCCLQDGSSALMVASENGHVEVVGKLTAAGAKLDLLKKVRESGVPVYLAFSLSYFFCCCLSLLKARSEL